MASEKQELNLEVRLNAAVENLNRIQDLERQLTRVLDLYNKIGRAASLASGLSRPEAVARTTKATSSSVTEEQRKAQEAYRVAKAEVSAAIQEAQTAAKALRSDWATTTAGKEIKELQEGLAKVDQGYGEYLKTFRSRAEAIARSVSERSSARQSELAGIQAPGEFVSKNKKREYVKGTGGDLVKAEQEASAIRSAMDDLASASEKAAKKKVSAAKSEQKAIEDSAEKTIQTSKSVVDAVKTPPSRVAAQRQELLGRLGTALRSNLATAAQSPFGTQYRPTTRELRGTQLPLADRRLLGAPMGNINTAALQAAFASLTSSANAAAFALSKIQPVSAPAGGGSAGGGAPVNTNAATLASQIMAEMLAFPKAWAQMHGAMRFNEAQFNNDYGKELEARNKRAAAAYNKAVADVGNVWASSSRGARQFRAEQDGIIGQVRNVIGLAAGYQVLQGIATELGQVFGHLKGGIIGYNAMIEQARVGFTTLFQNQYDQIVKSTAAFDAQKNLIDYLAMGYSSAAEAAEKLIGQIKDFANVTPFRFAELNESALRMRAFGFSMQEILQRSKTDASGFEGALVSVGNAVAALGGGADAFRRITYALGQMKQAGRVYQNDMMQLANAGIGAYKYIAEALRKEITEGNSGRREDVKAGQEKLYDELSKNAIETVRRLTTNGQISGEAAARAIMDGLNQEFADGMLKQSKTFIGALSTVADVSQSIVATAFEPMFKSISAVTYQFGQFLLSNDAKKFTSEMKGVIETITLGFGGVGTTIARIVLGTFSDLSNAIDKVSNATSAFGSTAGSVFKFFANGIGTIGDALSNQYLRQLALAAAATKLVFAFQSSNPFLSQVMLVIAAIGLLRTAYEQDLGGIRRNFDSLYTSVQPLLRTIQQDLIPAIGTFAAVFGATVVDTIIVGFKAIEPALTVIVRAFAELIKVLSYFKEPIAAVAIAMAGMFIGNKILGGFRLISGKITELMFKYDQLAKKAKAAADAMRVERTMPGYTAVADRRYRMVTDPVTGQKKRDYYLTGETRQVPKTKTPIAVGNQEVTSRVFPGFGALAKGVLSGAGGVGAGLLGATMLLEASDAPEAITSLVNQVSTALLGFSMLQNILPVGTFDIIKRSIGDFLDYVKQGFNSVPWASIGQKISGLFDTILGASYKGGSALAGKLGASMASQALMGSIVAAIVAVGGVALIVALAVGAAALIFGDMLKDKQKAPKPGDPDYRYLAGEAQPGYVGDEGYRQILAERARGGIRLPPSPVTGFGGGQEAFNAFRAGERYIGETVKATNDLNVGLDAVNKKYGLLVNQQKKAAGAQELLNLKLQRAKDALAAATQKFEELATAALERLLNPDQRMNPYTGLMEAGLEAEEVLKIEQEMGMVDFTNAQGLVRSFEEYRDVLAAIKPLSDADMTNGKISLKAVNERLKIEKERRKEQERIKALAQAEYDLGLAVLQQYDESIDPLQRGIQLRNSQKKYEEDIQNLRMQGLEDLTEQAQASGEWTATSRAIQKRLQDMQKGQQLILDEMRDMFDKYNKDVAYILAHPDWSQAKKLEELDKLGIALREKLATDFGLTEDVLGAQVEIFNGQIKSVIDAANGANLTTPIPEIKWTQELLGKVKAGLDGLITMMDNKAARIAQLVAMIKAAASDSASLPASDTAKDISAKLNKVVTMIINSKRGSPFALRGVGVEIQRLSQMTDLGQISRAYSSIYGLLKTTFGATDEDFRLAGFASGGIMPKGRLSLVGERGPELVLPESRGLVLNNGITSRILAMLGGGSMPSANIVNINVNNPVIRNDGDIRKLAQEISRVQASQFRTEGGRLY